jgi:hypothetical protein
MIFRLEPTFGGTTNVNLAVHRQEKLPSMKIIDGLGKNGGPQLSFGSRYRWVAVEGFWKV